MEKNSIDRIMQLIDWSRSPEEQQEGICLARDIVCIKAFFQPIGPGYSKSVWDNCAIILSERSDNELNPYILDMLLWLQDLNWPGAEIIQQRLVQFQDVSNLSMCLNGLVPALSKLEQISWLMFLADLLRNPRLKEQLNPDVLQILLTACTPN